MIEITNEYKQVYEAIESKVPFIYLTGSAGTGKSTLIESIKKKYKGVGVCGTTGIAGVNIGGVTMHRFFNIPAKYPITKKHLQNSRIDFVQDTLLNTKLFIIDEISMCNSDMVEAMFYTLKRCFMGEKLPPILAVGDCFQLPPVKGDFFFKAPSLKNGFKKIRLTKVFRQKDDEFVKILEDIRVGGTKYLEVLNEKCCREPKHFVPILTTTNKLVTNYNYNKLKQLNYPSKNYKARLVGDVRDSQKPTDEILSLKVGAKVMFVKNDAEGRWVNGTIGEVDYLLDNEVGVIVDGTLFTVRHATWSVEVLNKKVGEFTQIPLKLAWAITVHKSQGQTFSEAKIDFSLGAFSEGQVYTALSRLISLEGIYLTTEIKKEDVICNKEVAEFFKGED